MQKLSSEPSSLLLFPLVAVEQQALLRMYTVKTYADGSGVIGHHLRLMQMEIPQSTCLFQKIMPQLLMLQVETYAFDNHSSQMEIIIPVSEGAAVKRAGP